MLKNTKALWLIIFLALVGASFIFYQYTKTENSTDQNIPASTSKKFNKNKLSFSDPESLWVIVNKKRPLEPKNFQPDDLVIPKVPLRSNDGREEMHLRKPAADALEDMIKAAKKDDVNLLLASGYRSYGLQTLVYNNYIRTEGRSIADTQSARPGYSEHQTGLALDVGGTNRICEIEACFAKTKEGKWVAANAYRFGYIIRYQRNTEDTVGYIYEPWHLRFVGKELSNEIKNQKNPPLENFFSLEPAPNY